jgi:hypothetical protein
LKLKSGKVIIMKPKYKLGEKVCFLTKSTNNYSKNIGVNYDTK